LHKEGKGRTSKFIKTGNRRVVSREWGRRELTCRCRISVWDNEKFLEKDGGNAEQQCEYT
jgi:hypothetical protein